MLLKKLVTSPSGSLGLGTVVSTLTFLSVSLSPLLNSLIEQENFPPVEAKSFGLNVPSIVPPVIYSVDPFSTYWRVQFPSRRKEDS